MGLELAWAPGVVMAGVWFGVCAWAGGGWGLGNMHRGQQVNPYVCLAEWALVLGLMWRPAGLGALVAVACARMHQPPMHAPNSSDTCVPWH